jgi:hypothetical protein
VAAIDHVVASLQRGDVSEELQPRGLDRNVAAPVTAQETRGELPAPTVQF